MGFLTPFILGVVAGGVAMWQFSKGVLSNEQTVGKTEPKTSAEGEEPIQTNDQVDARDDSGDDNGISADNLTTIRGIGSVYAQRLREAGIQTFAQLAELAPEQISEIVSQGKDENLINVQGWIEQAEELTKSHSVTA